MTLDPKNMFWDSCIFIRFLIQHPQDYLSDITDYISDVKNGKRKVYFSTIAFSEIRPRHLTAKNIGTINDLFKDLGSAFIGIDPNPNILSGCGRIRDVDPVHKVKTGKRALGVPDSIHLMTCLFIKETMGVDDIVFHSFDEGKSRGWEEKCVPPLHFEEWYEHAQDNAEIRKICELKRCKPEYPQKRLAV